MLRVNSTRRGMKNEMGDVVTYEYIHRCWAHDQKEGFPLSLTEDVKTSFENFESEKAKRERTEIGALAHGEVLAPRLGNTGMWRFYFDEKRIMDAWRYTYEEVWWEEGWVAMRSDLWEIAWKHEALEQRVITLKMQRDATFRFIVASAPQDELPNLIKFSRTYGGFYAAADDGDGFDKHILTEAAPEDALLRTEAAQEDARRAAWLRKVEASINMIHMHAPDMKIYLIALKGGQSCNLETGVLRNTVVCKHKNIELKQCVDMTDLKFWLANQFGVLGKADQL